MDPRRLGRWSWTTYIGKGHARLTVYSIYKPVLNNTGPLSVYQQHRTHLMSAVTNPDPLAIYDSDLQQELQKRIDSGEHLVIGGDFNLDIKTGSLSTMLSTLGLQEAILSQHPSSPPQFSTYIRNDRNRVIDGIWITPSLHITKCGYTNYDTWDHCTAWLELDLYSTFGSPQSNNPLRRSGRRLKLSEPETVQRYLRRLVSEVQDLNLLPRARALNTSASTTLTATQIQEMESIDTLRTQAMLRRTQMPQTSHGPGPVFPYRHPTHTSADILETSTKKEKRTQSLLQIAPTQKNPGRYSPRIILPPHHPTNPTPDPSMLRPLAKSKANGTTTTTRIP